MESPFDPTGDDIYFDVYYYSSEGEELGGSHIFKENVTDISNISLEIEELFTLSGTVTVTYDGNTVPFVMITPYDETTNEWLGGRGQISLEYPSNAVVYVVAV
jgi:hypothetical protein